MDKAQKKSLVSELKADIAEASTLVVTHYKGLSVAEITDLRRTLGAKNAHFRVVKNTLLRLVAANTEYESLVSYFHGPVAIAFSKDPVAAAKGVVDFAKKNDKLVILGGAVNSQKVDVSSIQMLATLPSLDELRAKLIGLINAPATRIASVLQAPGGQVARVIHAYSSKG